MKSTLLLPAQVPTRAKGFLTRFAGALGATTVEAPLERAPKEGFILLWLGGSEGRDITVAASVALRLVFLAANRAGLRPLALRLRPAAMIEDYAFMRAEMGLATIADAPSGLCGLKQAPLAAGASLGVGDYVTFQGTGEPVVDLLRRYLDWRALA